MRLFGPDAHVPGNLVYFKLLASNPGELSLQTASGTKIPASIRQIGPDRVFAPDAPIPSGTQVRLDYVEQCRGPIEMAQVARSYLFTTTSEIAAVRATSAHLEQRERGFVTYTPASDDEAFVRLSHTSPSDARHLIDSYAEVDGKQVQFDQREGYSLTVRSSCNPAHRNDPDTCGWYHRFAPGKHTVKVRYTMVGGLVALPAIEAPVELRCDDACNVRTEALDIGTMPLRLDDADGTSTAPLATDQAAGEQDDAETSSGGCSVDPSGRSGGSWLLAILVGLVATRRFPRVRRGGGHRER